MIFLRGVSIDARRGAYPFNSASLVPLHMAFTSPVTIIVGDNGSGKSTLLEALARALRLPAIGLDDAARDQTLSGLDPLADAMKLRFFVRTRRGFFLRAEDFFGFTRRVSAMQAELRGDLERVRRDYADKSAFTQGQARMAYESSLSGLEGRYGENPDACSHGEAFLNLFSSRLTGKGLYLLDEPEAPLSPLRQLTLCAMILEWQADSQFIIATHSPILMALPGAVIWSFDSAPAHPCAYEELESVALLRDFLNAPSRFMNRLME